MHLLTKFLATSQSSFLKRENISRCRSNAFSPFFYTSNVLKKLQNTENLWKLDIKLKIRCSKTGTQNVWSFYIFVHRTSNQKLKNLLESHSLLMVTIIVNSYVGHISKFSFYFDIHGSIKVLVRCLHHGSPSRRHHENHAIWDCRKPVKITIDYLRCLLDW